MPEQEGAAAGDSKQKDLDAERLGREFEDFITGRIPASKKGSVGMKLADLLQAPGAFDEHLESRKRYKDWLDSQPQE